MSPVPPSRLVLVSSLIVLGGSLGIFGSVTGIVPNDTHEFDIDDGALIATTSGGQQHVLVEDIRTVSRIEIDHVDGHHVVRTNGREPPTVDIRTRTQVQQILSAAKTVDGDIPTTESAVYTVRWIPSRLSSDRAAVIGATPNSSLRMEIAPNASAFTVQQHNDSIVFERRESQWSDDRVLVVVTPNESGAQYSAVINLRTETIESLVRLNRGGQ